MAHGSTHLHEVTAFHWEGLLMCDRILISLGHFPERLECKPLSKGLIVNPRDELYM